jgi:hypothetical protein
MTTRRGIVLCHGWGFAPDSLAELERSINALSARVVKFDLGYFGRAAAPRLDPGTEWIAIGHSFGFPYLLAQPVRWAAAVAIAGFTRFRAAPARREDRWIAEMRRRIAVDPARVLRDFYAACGLSGRSVPGEPDRARLSDDLAALERANPLLPRIPVLALAARRDGIVAGEVTEAAFSAPDATIRWNDDAAHALGITHAAWCAERITEFL